MQRNYKQLYIQFGYVAACSAYVFVVTALLCKFLDLIPGLKLRTPDEGEIVGMDEHEIGEFVADFVEVRRAFDTWNPPSVHSETKEVDATDEIVAAGDRHGGVGLLSLRNIPLLKFECLLLVYRFPRGRQAIVIPSWEPLTDSDSVHHRGANREKQPNITKGTNYCCI